MLTSSLICWISLAAVAESASSPPPPAEGVVRLATYNVSLYRDQPGQLIRDLEGGAVPQARRIAEVIQRVRPHVLLLCEFDYDAAQRAVGLFHDRYLGRGQNGQSPIAYPHRFTAPVNTGLPTAFDLDRDGNLGGPADAMGYGRHEGQYGMVVLSQLPIDRQQIRTFQRFLWKDMPRAMLPTRPTDGRSYYLPQELAVLRLSSKSFWDVPIVVDRSGSRRTIHFLCSHPTPPVFDGPEDRNGRRNHDEIRLLADYVSGWRGAHLVDDEGLRGGMSGSAPFVIAGDLNADPVDGSVVPGAIAQLLDHPRVNSSAVPTADGGSHSASFHAELNADHRGDPTHDTADFSGDGVGNLRVDYVLPSRELRVVATGIFWPPPGEPGSEAITASDHRLVWLDVAVAD